MTIKRAVATICIFFIVGCAQQSVGSDEPDSFANVYAEAEAALATATANRNVWSKTEDILRQSKLAFAEGREDDAIKLASEAKLQAELALEQAISQEEDWRSNIFPQ